jgi:hypothetical protein
VGHELKNDCENIKRKQARALSTGLVERVPTINKRSLDPFSAKVYFYYARSYELLDRLEEIRAYVPSHPTPCLPPLFILSGNLTKKKYAKTNHNNRTLLSALRTATLRNDDETQTYLLNLLLRNYLHYNLYDQAEKLVSKTTVSESAANHQLARYLYYLGAFFFSHFVWGFKENEGKRGLTTEYRKDQGDSTGLYGGVPVLDAGDAEGTTDGRDGWVSAGCAFSLFHILLGSFFLR